MKKTKKSKILGPPTPYVTMLDDVVEARREKNPQEMKMPLRPSAAGYCERRLGYDLNEFLGFAKYEHEIKDPPTDRLLNLGHHVERHSLSYFYDLKLVEPETQIKYTQQSVSYQQLPAVGKQPAHIIEGSTDLVIYMKDWRCVADVKSKKDKFSHAFKTDWDESIERIGDMSSTERMKNPDGTWSNEFWVEDLALFIDEMWDTFFCDNFYQLNGYALTSFFRNRGVDHCLLYRYCKNDSRHLGIRFKPHEEVDEYVQKKFAKVWEKVAGGKGPEALTREHAMGSMRCAFCDYKDECWEGKDAKKAWFKTLGGPTFAKPTKELGITEKIEAAANRIVYYKLQEKAIKADEQKVAAVMLQKNVDRMRLSDGSVVELKFLKSPYPHYELRKVPR